ncbi:lysin [Pseudomonas phage phiB1_1]|uniref:Lysozyme n=1 Tax=Pseudomonas phage phiB1_1 TaxID=2755402 RepID=A0A7D7JRF6_9CAUD|nr:lysin [Pseudomonas phage phiB1_1]UAW53688.1 lysin [Pseudomonas phage pphageB21]UAW53747.1 lysin [Pseudomonas phage pphageT21]UAW53866.1 lysin [Pseudomonas phage pphageBV72]
MSLRSRLINLGAAGAVLAAAAFLGPTEELRTVPYADIGGVKTWCYGQTVGIPKARFSVAECDADLLRSVSRYTEAIKPYTVGAPASVVAAMVSVQYNTQGPGKPHAVFLKPLAERDWRAACDAIVAPWQGKYGVSKGFKATVQGRPLRGLENRRAKEFDLCVSGL